jgi:hypothetical protein
MARKVAAAAQPVLRVQAAAALPLAVTAHLATAAMAAMVVTAAVPPPTLFRAARVARAATAALPPVARRGMVVQAVTAATAVRVLTEPWPRPMATWGQMAGLVGPAVMVGLQPRAQQVMVARRGMVAWAARVAQATTPRWQVPTAATAVPVEKVVAEALVVMVASPPRTTVPTAWHPMAVSVVSQALVAQVATALRVMPFHPMGAPAVRAAPRVSLVVSVLPALILPVLQAKAKLVPDPAAVSAVMAVMALIRLTLSMRAATGVPGVQGALG